MTHLYVLVRHHLIVFLVWSDEFSTVTISFYENDQQRGQKFIHAHFLKITFIKSCLNQPCAEQGLNCLVILVFKFDCGS